MGNKATQNKKNKKNGMERGIEERVAILIDIVLLYYYYYLKKLNRSRLLLETADSIHV